MSVAMNETPLLLLEHLSSNRGKTDYRKIKKTCYYKCYAENENILRQLRGNGFLLFYIE